MSCAPRYKVPGGLWAVRLLPITSILLMSFPAHGDCRGDLFFGPAVFYATGNNARDVAVADFNRDGILDIAVANSDLLIGGGVNSSISILIGQGSGGVGTGAFSSPVNYLAHDRPFSIATGDFNRDGNIDLAVSNWGSGDVSILAGHGDGTFAPPLQFPAGPTPYTVVSGDFDLDGLADLAVANYTAATISILIGDGNGFFAAPVSYGVAGITSSIVTADFNNDGLADLAATCNYQGVVSVLLGKGLGKSSDPLFRPAVDYNAGPEPFDLAVGDFNEDGIMDLAVSNGANGGVAILGGHGQGGLGDGTFASPVFYGAGINGAGVVVGDFNQDDIQDLAVSFGSNDAIALLLGQGSHGVGNGSFGPPAYYTVPGFPAGSLVRDLNGDGRGDLVVADYFSGGVSVLLGDCLTSAPHLVSVRDVPNDQGGRVFVRWLRSALDVAPQRSITGYRVWRRIPPTAESVARAHGLVSRPTGAQLVRLIRLARPDGASEVTYWEALATLPAEYLEGYGYTAPTTQDSMRRSNPYTAFFVSALTADPFVFYESNVDSGYSVDNIRPSRPHGFTDAYSGGEVTLNWDASPDVDLFEYHLYRGSTAEFEPSPGNMIATSTDTTYADRGGGPSNFYKLTGVDIHGNESDPALATPSGTTAAESPAMRLALAMSNPISQRMVIVFSIPSSLPATLDLVDVSGRRLRSVAVGALGPGTHRLDFSTGAPIASGIYLVRLSQAGKAVTAKVCFVR